MHQYTINLATFPYEYCDARPRRMHKNQQIQHCIASIREFFDFFDVLLTTHNITTMNSLRVTSFTRS